MVYAIDVLEYIVKMAKRIRFVEEYLPIVDDPD